ncbi:MAG: hypothetical protein HQ581_17780 [Planctomycetes bacterium]|nr:hypothetical protein [Planctomycetota bacterium]
MLERDPTKELSLRETHTDARTAMSDGRLDRPAGASQPAVRVAFHGFWGGFNFKQFVRMFRLVAPDYEFEPSDHPDVVFTSVFARDRDAGKRRWPKAVQVFFTGENRRPPLADFHYCISFYRDLEDPRHLRMPIFVPELGACGYRMSDLVKSGPIGDVPFRRPRFCAFIQRNCGVRLRNQFVERLQDYKRVDCPGPCMNNMSIHLPGIKSKIDFLRQYKFAVCFENTTTRGDEGYVTEKLPHAMLAGCIPLYAGDQRVGEDFNPRSFVNLNDISTDVDAMVRRVIDIDQNDGQCQAIAEEPWFVDNRVPEHFDETRMQPFFRQVMAHALRNRDRSHRP